MSTKAYASFPSDQTFAYFLSSFFPPFPFNSSASQTHYKTDRILIPFYQGKGVALALKIVAGRQINLIRKTWKLKSVLRASERNLKQERQKLPIIITTKILQSYIHLKQKHFAH